MAYSGLFPALHSRFQRRHYLLLCSKGEEAPNFFNPLWINTPPKKKTGEICDNRESLSPSTTRGCAWIQIDPWAHSRAQSTLRYRYSQVLEPHEAFDRNFVAVCDKYRNFGGPFSLPRSCQKPARPHPMTEWEKFWEPVTISGAGHQKKTSNCIDIDNLGVEQPVC